MYYCIFSRREKEGPRGSQPPPLLRSSTLPAIIVPGLNILHAQIGPNSTPNGIVQNFLLKSRWFLRRDPQDPNLHLNIFLKIEKI